MFHSSPKSQTWREPRPPRLCSSTGGARATAPSCEAATCSSQTATPYKQEVAGSSPAPPIDRQRRLPIG